MDLVRLSTVNRLFLVGWTAGVVAVAVRAPTLGPLATLPSTGPLSALSLSPNLVRYGALAAVWLVGVGTTLAWQRTLWTTMGSGAGFRTDGGPGLVRLPAMQTARRDHIVTAEAVRPGRSPLARMRVRAAVDHEDPVASFELGITTESDPEGRVLFEAPDADRRYVLRDATGDLDAVFQTDFKADLVDVAVPGTIRVAGSRVSYETADLPFDAGCLSACAAATVRVAEQVERASEGRRSN
jgi:hypothetical protein